MLRRALVLPALSTCLLGAMGAAAHADSSDPATAAALAAMSPAKAGGGTGGTTGVYVRELGKTAPVVAANETVEYEPASSVKPLVAIALEQEFLAGTSKPTDPDTTLFHYPNSSNSSDPDNPNLCPDVDDEVPANKRTGVALGAGDDANDAEHQMLSISDNIMTRSLVLHEGGLGPANAVAASAGMTSTSLGQDLLGCGYLGGKRNFSTLVDMSKLYEAIDTSRLLPSSARDHLYSKMWHGYWGRDNNLGPTVVTEAAKLGLPDSAVTNFLNKAWFAVKGGSYNIGCGNPPISRPDGCTTTAGVANDVVWTGLQRLPFLRADGTEYFRTFTFGAFIYDRICSQGYCGTDAFGASAGIATAEALRGPVHAALLSLKLPGDIAPVAAFTPSTGSPSYGASMDFDASASSDADGTVASYDWDFGDGSTGSGPTTSHAYTTSGAHTVTLTVTDDIGKTDTTRFIVVVGPAPTPVATLVPPTPNPTPNVASPAPTAVPLAQVPQSSRDTTKPIISKVSLPGFTSGKPSKLSLTLSEPASLSVTVTKPMPGRKHGTDCVKSTSKLAHAAPCTRQVRQLAATTNASAGTTILTLAKLIKLGAGRYRVSAQATDVAGNVSDITTATFRVTGAKR